jgi:replicative DNA helicase
MALPKASKTLKEPIILVKGEQAADRLIDYVRGRRDGTITSVRTKYNKLNDSLMGGFEWNTILAIAALSGFGKSLLEKEIVSSASKLNGEVEILRFNFEMEAAQQVAREIVGSLGYDLKTLYSVKEPLNEEAYTIFLKAIEDYKNSSENTCFEEIPIDYDEIRNIIIM